MKNELDIYVFHFENSRFLNVGSNKIFYLGAGSPAHLAATLQSAHLQQLQQLQSHIMRSAELRSAELRSAELRSSPFLSPQSSLLHSSARHSAQTGKYSGNHLQWNARHFW